MEIVIGPDVRISFQYEIRMFVAFVLFLHADDCLKM